MKHVIVMVVFVAMFVCAVADWKPWMFPVCTLACMTITGMSTEWLTKHIGGG